MYVLLIHCLTQLNLSGVEFTTTRSTVCLQIPTDGMLFMIVYIHPIHMYSAEQKPD